MSDNNNFLFASSKNRSIISDCSLTEIFQCISELQAPAFINVDFRNINEVLDNCNYAVITSTIGEGINRVANAISMILASPLWEDYDLKSSQMILIKLLCARNINTVNTDEMCELTKFNISLPQSVDIKWCIGDDSSLGDKVKLILFGAFKKKSLFNHL